MAETEVDSSPESSEEDVAGASSASEQDSPSPPEVKDGESPESYKSKTEKRFSKLLDEKKQAEANLSWYRENIGDPNDVIAYRKWKAEQEKAEKESAKPEELTPDKAKAVRDLIRQADPEIKEIIEMVKAERQQADEAMFERADREIQKLAKEAGYDPEDEELMEHIGGSVGRIIATDKSLAALWKIRDLDSVREAFGKYQGLVEKIQRKAVAKSNGELAQTKRKTASLPSIAAGAPTVSAPPKRAKDDLGITKSAHDHAWAILQQD